MARILVIGYGNPGRMDDGLGPAMATLLERMGLADVTVDAAYQLAVEHAAALRDHDAVFFVDASRSGPEPFGFDRAAPLPAVRFSSHVVTPATVLALASDVFGVEIPAFVLAIRGYDFDGFGERLSDRAGRNLEAAARFLVPFLQRHAPAPLADAPARAACREGMP